MATASTSTPPALALVDFPLPPIRLERSGSRPSPTHSATSISSRESPVGELGLISSSSYTQEEPFVAQPTDRPLEVGLQGSSHIFSASQPPRAEKIAISTAPVKKGFGLSLSKSVQNLRGKAKKDKELEKPPVPIDSRVTGPKSSTVSMTRPPPTPPLPTQAHPGKPVIPNAVPVRPKAERASSSGFFSMFKKSKNKEPTPPQSIQPVTIPQNVVMPHRRPPQPMRAQTQTVRSKPSLPNLQTGSQQVPRLPQPSTAPPSSTTPQLPLVRPTDPTKIPLPPSPRPDMAERTLFEDQAARDTRNASNTFDGGMLSLEGFEIDEHSVPARQQGALRLPPGAQPASRMPPPRPASHMPQPVRRPSQPEPTTVIDEEAGFSESSDENADSEEGEDEKEIDKVPSLAPIRVPSSSGSVERPLITPVSTTSKIGEVDSIVSPISISVSDSNLSEELAEARDELDSPNKRMSQMGDVGLNLGRADGKWRRSVMDFNNPLNKRNSQRTVQRAPPTSYDAYLATQQRQASHRISAMPVEFDRRRAMASGVRTMAKHDRAAQQDMDTFFLS